MVIFYHETSITSGEQKHITSKNVWVADKPTARKRTHFTNGLLLMLALVPTTTAEPFQLLIPANLIYFWSIIKAKPFGREKMCSRHTYGPKR